MAEAQAGEEEREERQVDRPAPVLTGDVVVDTLQYLASQLVEHRDAVRVEQNAGERGTIYRLHVHPDDMGRVIGKAGRIARALRQVTRAAAARTGAHAIVEIVD
jgi:predicted RNA-binding protein YlqC (UPF0109 family)